MVMSRGDTVLVENGNQDGFPIPERQRRERMSHRGIRMALAVIELFIGLGAIGGGIALLTSAFIFDRWLPVAWLQGTPFSTYLIPGLVLLIIVGGGMLLAAATLFIQREWAVLLSGAMGFMMVGFEAVEVAIIDRYAQAVIPSTIVQQALFTILGLLIIGLAGYLWTREYHAHSFLTRHMSHA
jgi:hypothetical protein